MKPIRQILALVALSFLALAASKAEAAPPNIVLIVGQDLEWWELGFMGHEEIETPKLDALAAGALVFERGYVPSDNSRPNLVSILSGLHPHQHGIVSQAPPVDLEIDLAKHRSQWQEPRTEAQRAAYLALLDEIELLPARLTRAGYAAYQAGRWWEGDFARGGFTHGLAKGKQARAGLHGSDALEVGRWRVKPIEDFIGQSIAEQRPFFVYYAPVMPDLSKDPPNRLHDKYRGRTKDRDLARRWGHVESFDESVGRVLHALEESGVVNETLVVFLVDRGRESESLEDDDWLPIDALRTPIVIRWPSTITAKRNDTTPVSAVDLFPTLLAAANLDATTAYPGIDLRDAAAVAARKAIHGAYYEATALDLADPVASLRLRWTVEEEWNLMLPWSKRYPRAKPELYNLRGSPRKQTKNLARARPPLVDRLSRGIDRWWKP